MRTLTLIKTYATFRELSDKQKKQVIEDQRYINVECIDWWYWNKRDFREVLEHLGYGNIESHFSGFYSQGDGASFSGIFDLPTKKDTLQKRLDNLENDYHTFFKDNEELKEMFLNLDFAEEIEDDEECLEIFQHGRYSHEMTMQCYNDSLLEVSRELARKYYRDLESTYDYLMSDEAIIETLEANEYEFDLDTLRIG